jgi:hypothetical protein
MHDFSPDRANCRRNAGPLCSEKDHYRNIDVRNGKSRGAPAIRQENCQASPRCSATPAMTRAMPASSPATGICRKVEGAPAEAPGGGRNSPASGAPWRADRRHRGSSRTYGHRQITFILGLQGEVAATKRHGGACDGWRFIPGQSSGGPDAAPSCSANPRIPCMKPRIWSLKRANSSSLNKPRVRRWQYVSRLLTGACR